MYQTLLCSQLLSVENAHCLRAGALNDEMDEEQGGVVQACRLPQQYNALDFKATDTDSIPMIVNNSTQYPDMSASTVTDENNSRVTMPVFCGFEEEELLSEQYKK